MSWWSDMKRKLAGSPRGAPTPEPRGASPGARWRDAAENRFGVPVLDLSPVTQGMLSTTRDPAIAARAVGWGTSTGAELDDAALGAVAPLACALRYPAASLLPEGLLFTPGCMEEKWVIALRGGAILAARSWTGGVEAVAETRREGAELVVHTLRVADPSALRVFGDPVLTFDWLMRSHALGQVLALPADDAGLALLEATPLAVFSPFGARALCAARGWAPPPPDRPLRSDGALLIAVRAGDAARVRALCAAGEPVNAPTTCLGYTALSVALVRGDVALVRALLELGADPDARSDGGNFPLGHGIVHQVPIEALEALVARGADLRAVNDDGFGALHAAAEVGHAALVPWLLEKGLDLEARTGRGHTPLHLASALGHVDAAAALLDAGAEAGATSPEGTARQIAEAQGKPDIVALLDRRARG
jgi:ankyrin repeat protein